MNPTPEEVLQKARERGFTVHAQSVDKTWYAMRSEKSPIGLQLYPNTNEFEIVYMQGIATLTTSKCGSFMDDTYFKRMANQMHKLVMHLKLVK